jgi:predicted N-acetyltransferase YhbS
MKAGHAAGRGTRGVRTASKALRYHRFGYFNKNLNQKQGKRNGDDGRV